MYAVGRLRPRGHEKRSGRLWDTSAVRAIQVRMDQSRDAILMSSFAHHNTISRMGAAVEPCVIASADFRGWRGARASIPPG